MEQKNIGFIGLGHMGRGMVNNLLKGGYRVRVFDSYEPAMNAAEEAGALPSTLPELVRESEMVLLSLPTPEIVEDVVLGPNGIYASSHSELLVIDLSSSTPESEKKIAAEGKKIGVDYMDAPVSGGEAGAVNGTLTIMVGGQNEVVTRATPVLQNIGERIVHVGPVGSAQAVKLVNQLLFGINLAAVAEALRIAEGLGVDLEVLYDIISTSSGNSNVFQTRCLNFIHKGNFEAGAPVDIVAKDLRLVVSKALEVGQPSFLGSLALQLYEGVRRKGYGRKDASILYKYLAGDM